MTYAKKTRQRITTTLLLTGLLFPQFAKADEPILESIEVSSGDTSVKIGLDAQFRYGYTAPEGGADTSEFSLRRFRPIFGFKAFEVFEAKFVPEFAEGPELKDAVLIWAANDMFSLEAGQFAPPFNWERDGSSDYHMFTERSVANREFQIADGRDIGVQFDFEWDKWLDVEAGIFNGAGSNTKVTPGASHVISGRIAYAPFASYHEVEVVPIVLDQLMLMVAVGGFVAFDNAWRDWSAPGTIVTEPESADVWALTSDLHVWAWRFSLHAQGFYRQASPENSPTYTGMGVTGQLGFLVIHERLLMALRYSHAAADTQRAGTNEMAASLQVFHIGNQSKFTFDAGMINHVEDTDRTYFRLQYQLLL